MIGQQKSFSSALFWALTGFSLVIIVHECGHFLVARLSGIACPLFSIGFGPALFSRIFGKTVFQIAVIPLGGYVLIDPEQFNSASYGIQCSITLAGIFFNLVFAYVICLLLSINKYRYVIDEEQLEIHHDHYGQKNAFRHAFSLYTYILTHLNKLVIQTFTAEKQGFIGPIGIMKGLVNAAQDGVFLYLLSIIILNVNIAFFNLLPIPFLDGGRLVQIIVTLFFGKQPFSVIISISIFLLFLFSTILSYLQTPITLEKNKH